MRETFPERGGYNALCAVALYRAAELFARRDSKADIFFVFYGIYHEIRRNIYITFSVRAAEAVIFFQFNNTVHNLNKMKSHFKWL